MEVGQGLTIGPRTSFRRRRGSVHAVASCVVCRASARLLRTENDRLECGLFMDFHRSDCHIEKNHLPVCLESERSSLNANSSHGSKAAEHCSAVDAIMIILQM